MRGTGRITGRIRGTERIGGTPIVRNGRWAAAAPGLAALAVGVAPAPSGAQQDFSDVQIEATHVAGNVYMLVGRGGNIGVSSGPDGALMVDDQFAPLADKVRAALREVARAPEGADLRFVLNTHFHGDHVGGNVEFGPEATIIAHANVRKRLARPEAREDGTTPDPMAADGLPVVTFGDSVSIHFNGEEIRAIHLGRGHTDGDAVIFFTESNVIHMGDDFFAGRFPFVDLASGGSVQGLARAVGLVLDQAPADVHVIPGHGPLSTLDDLRMYKRMLEETMDLVAGHIDEGASLEEVVAAGVPAEWAEWGSGFISTERWLQTVYQSLTDEGSGRRGAASDRVDASHGGNYGRDDGHGHDHAAGHAHPDGEGHEHGRAAGHAHPDGEGRGHG